MFMKQQNGINQPIKDAIQYLSQRTYSRVSIYSYSRVWRKFIAFAEEKRVESYSTQLCKDFMGFFVEDYKSGCIGKFGVSKIRALRVLDDIFHGNRIGARYLLVPIYIPECFRIEYDAYKDYIVARGQKPKTLKSKLSRLLVLLRYLEKTGHRLCELNFQALTEFREYLSTRYTKNAKANIEFTIRDFLICAESKGFITNETSSLLGTIYSNKHERLPSTYTSAEISSILSSVDRITVSGKRDYALLILMTLLGIRSSDLCNLQLDAIRPENRSLVFMQQKTGNYESLPLTEAIEMALADYLKNARPESDSGHIFVKNEGANRGAPLTTSTIYNILNRYMKRAGIETEGKRHGPHSMRHSLSSNLLKEGTPIPVITGILGHSSSEITTRYLWMDMEQLRTLALEVPYENNTKSPIAFEYGIFTPLVISFIQYKRSCGLKYEDSAEYVLRTICRKLNQYPLDRPELTKVMVDELVQKRPEEKYSTQSGRIVLLRQLALYLNRQGATAYVYPGQSVHKGKNTFVPYLLSDDEIERVFKAADSLRSIIRYPRYQEVYPVLLRLLYSSGLRLSEALNLKLKHFIENNNAILIENSKKGKSRCIPLSASMSCVIKNYINKRFGIQPSIERYIFEAPDGGRYNRSSVRSTIMNIFKTAGIPTAIPERHVRVHDVRHLFAVKSMEKMKLGGMDLYCAMPLLSE
jgi:site-specific recombinase XerD